MSTSLTLFIKALVVVPVTLLPIVNPIATAPIFTSMTGPLDPVSARRLSKRIAINCFFMLIGAVFIGSYLLEFFGISLPIVRVAGGIVVATSGWKLLNDQGQDSLRNSVAQNSKTWSSEDLKHKSFFPYSFPLTVGPGTIATSITLGTQMPNKPIDWILISVASILGVFVTSVVIYLCYRFARNMQDLLGEIGATVVMRLSAFILLCIGIEIFWNGASELMNNLSH